MGVCCVLCACNSLLASFEKAIPVTGLRVEFSKEEPSLQWNGLFSSDGVHGMPEGKDYQCIEMVCSFICAYVDKAIGCIEGADLTKVNSNYSELQLEFYSRSSKRNMDFKAWVALLT